MADAPLHVLHLVGSAVDDFHADLSRLYARDALAALADPIRYRMTVAHVGPDRSWRFPDAEGPDALDPAVLRDAPPLAVGDALKTLVELAPDVAVPQMFCLPGMTTYRALLDLIGLPFLGNTAQVMANAAHKGTARAIAAAAGVAVPAGVLLRRGEARPGDLPEFPVVVKPVAADNSVGVSLVRDPAELPAALDEAFSHGPQVLVERYVPLGREVRGGIVVRDGRPVCLPLEEYAVHTDTKPIRDRADKLARTEDGDLRLVAKDAEHAWTLPVDDPVTEAVWDAARRCHDAFGARHHSLFDFRVDAGGRPWFLEAGPYCSFSPGSVVAVMAAAAGTPLPQLFADTLAEARRDGARRDGARRDGAPC